MSEQIEVRLLYGSAERKTTVRIGGEYVVKPLNPRKKKHRDRPCVIIDFVPVSEQHPRDLPKSGFLITTARAGRS